VPEQRHLLEDLDLARQLLGAVVGRRAGASPVTRTTSAVMLS